MHYLVSTNNCHFNIYFYLLHLCVWSRLEPTEVRRGCPGPLELGFTVDCQPHDVCAGNQTQTLYRNHMQGTGEMAQWLGPLAALPEILGSIPSNHMVTDRSL